MKFVGLRDLRSKTGQLWRDLETDSEIILTNNGKPLAILCATTEKDLEVHLAALRRARAMLSLAQIHTDSLKKGTDKITNEEIDEEIKLVRRNRKR